MQEIIIKKGKREFVISSIWASPIVEFVIVSAIIIQSHPPLAFYSETVVSNFQGTPQICGAPPQAAPSSTHVIP
jgi:hypothetical protein